MTNAAAPDLSRGTIDMAVFFAAGRRLGLEARHVRSLTRVQDAGDRRRIEDALGLLPAGAPSGAPYSLQLKQTEAAFLVDGPVEFVSLPAMSIHPLPPLLAACTRLRGLRALAFMEGAGGSTLILLFDGEAVGSQFETGRCPGLVDE